jgi:hypothetical protein
MLKVTLVNYQGFTAGEILKLRASLQLLEKVVNGAEFKARILNHQFNGRTQFANNDGLSNEEILGRILSGVEVKAPEADSEIDLSLAVINSSLWQRFRRSVVGYTDPKSGVIHTYRTFYHAMNPHELAAHYMHEWCHCNGFGHDYYGTPQRPYSVPYAVGSIVSELAKGLSISE